MALSERIREERQRLGMSQTAFASLAGVTKSAQIKWEGGASSAPTAPALAGWAQAGADVLYMLTGRRSGQPHANIPGSEIEAQLSRIRRDLVDPSPRALPDETGQQTEARVLELVAGELSAILRYDQAFLTDQAREEVEELLAAATNPAQLALYRAADYVQARAHRREMKERISQWFSEGGYQPAEQVNTLLATLALDYSVPVKLLVDLVHELHDDMLSRIPRNPRDLGVMEPSR